MNSPNIEEGLTIRPPCRFELIKQFINVEIDAYSKDYSTDYSNENKNKLKNVEVDVILDIAHNADAMLALVRKIKGLYPNRILRVVIGMSADKDVRSCILPVLDLVNYDTKLVYTVAVSV